MGSIRDAILDRLYDKNDPWPYDEPTKEEVIDDEDFEPSPLPLSHGVDYLSKAVEDRVQSQLAGPALELAVKKIEETWPNRTFVRHKDTLYVLSGFIWVQGTAYSVTLEAGTDGKGLVCVKKAKGEGNDAIIESSPLDKLFHTRFPALLADAIAKLINRN